MSLSQVWGITITANPNSQIFILHIQDDHDYHYHSQQSKMPILALLNQQYYAHTQKQLPFYFRSETELPQCCTFKHHLKEKKNVKPTEKGTFLSQYYFMEHEFRGIEAVCDYSLN